MSSSPEINRFNEQWRSSPLYAQGLASVGADPTGPLHLSDGQRKQLQAFIEQNMGTQFPKGVEVDPAGNMNEDEGFSKHKKWIIPAAIGIGTMGLGAAGVGPAAGLFGGGGSAAGGAAAGGGALASSAVPTSLAMGAVPGIGAAGGAGMAGLGGILGTIGKFAGPLSSIGSVLGGAAKGSADQRYRESDALARQQQLLQQGARDQFSAGMQGAQFQREGQDRARKQQILMSLLNNTQDANIQPGNPAIAARMGPSTGGARPSNLTSNRESLMALLGQPQVSAPTFTPPPQMPLPRAGLGENILGGIGLGSSILGALGSLRR